MPKIHTNFSAENEKQNEQLKCSNITTYGRQHIVAIMMYCTYRMRLNMLIKFRFEISKATAENFFSKSAVYTFFAPKI